MRLNSVKSVKRVGLFVGGLLLLFAGAAVFCQVRLWASAPIVTVAPYQDASDVLREQVLSGMDVDTYQVLPGNRVCVFMSCSVGNSLPVVRHAVANTVADAWNVVDGQMNDFFSEKNLPDLEVRYLKVDVVSNVSEMAYADVCKSITARPIGQWPYGLAFDDAFDVALLQQEWSHYRLFDCNQGRISLYRTNPYLEGQSGQSIDAVPDTLTAFQCDAWLYDADDGSVIRLSSKDENYGIRDFELTPDTLTVMLLTAGYYLEQNISYRGKFQYAYWPQDMDYTAAYSTVRHIDALWALEQYYELTEDPMLQSVLDAGIAYLFDYVVDAGDDGVYVRCTDQDEAPGEIRMGGMGLLAIVLSEYERLFDSDVYRDFLDGVVRGIMTQIQSDGHVTHVLNSDLTVCRDFWSEYYEGEVMLGLTYAYRQTGNPDYLSAVEKVAGYCLDHDYGTTGDHWFVMAMNELTSVVPDATAYYQAGLTAVARQFDELAVCDMDLTKLEQLMGAFGLYQRSGQVGVSIPDEFDLSRFSDVLRLQMNELLNCYLFPEKAMYSPVIDAIIGCFYAEASDGWKIRIDLIQHCMDGYYRVLMNYDAIQAMFAES